ncbi:MAG TPA: hypothetical protein PKW79_04255, partial [Rhabdochlamydiaceae bacterium]|nr:hypothetical protein [Rhabdochlamydiaceae bacterium]
MSIRLAGESRASRTVDLEGMGTEMIEVASWKSDPVVNFSAKTTAAVKKKGGVVVNFVDVKLTKSPTFEVNGKTFKITHIRHREHSGAQWKTIKIADLSQTEIDKLATTCEGLFKEIHPSKRTNLEEVTFKFTRKNFEPSWRDHLGPLSRKAPAPHPLQLSSISTKAPGAKKAETHKFELEEFDEPSQKKLKTMMSEADKPIHAIAEKIPRQTARSVASIEKTKQLTKSPETDALIKVELANLQKLFAEVLDHGTKKEELSQAIQIFQNRYNPQQYPQEFQVVEEMKHVLEQMPHKTDPGVSQQPADGNCFFHAMAEALNKIKKAGGLPDDLSGIEEFTHDHLRAFVVDMMGVAIRDGNAEFTPYLEQSIEALKAAKLKQIHEQRLSIEALSPEIKKQHKAEIDRQLEALQREENFYTHITPEQYLEMVAQDGSFASSAEMYAISKLFKVNIAIERQVGDRRITGFDLIIIGDESEEPITIKLLHVNGDHFDLIGTENVFYDLEEPKLLPSKRRMKGRMQLQG